MDDIKKFLRPSVKSRFRQGYYTPQNPSKYKGDPTKIIYRSSWEKKFMIWLDMTDKVTEWNSEGMSIKYFYEVDNKQHTYFPDFYFSYQKDESTLLKYIIEVKPHSQLSKPRRPSVETYSNMMKYKMRLENYIKIENKTKYIKRWCRENGFIFSFLTEKSNLI